MELFEEIFGKTSLYKTQSNTNIGYHCTKCAYELTRTNPSENFGQKMFFCSNNKCEKYGIVVVIAIKKQK